MASNVVVALRRDNWDGAPPGIVPELVEKCSQDDMKRWILS